MCVARLVLADTDKLHGTISEMSKRIRQLEDALQIEHGMRSTDSHPLLSDDMLAVKKGLEHGTSTKERNSDGDDNCEDEEDEPDVVNAMGLLTISEGGALRYLGATGSEVRHFPYFRVSLTNNSMSSMHC